MSEATRQHYKLATGAGLSPPPSKTPTPGKARGGKAPPPKKPK